MAGTRKTDTSPAEDTSPVKDAPPLEDKEAEKADELLVAAQAQPMDEQEMPTTPPAEEAKVVVTLDMPGVPRAGEYEVKEGQHDPSLVAIPGLGQFRNGTSTPVSAEQLMVMSEHYKASNVDSGTLPAGVTIEEEGK